MEIVITHHWANLSRGRISAKHVKDGAWGERGSGTVTLDRPGKWMISATDGFNRKETQYVVVSEDGNVELPGRFEFA